MIELAHLSLADPATAAAVLELQRRAYRIEAELIGSDGNGIPPLRDTIDELRSCGETFLGAVFDGLVVGAIS